MDIDNLSSSITQRLTENENHLSDSLSAIRTSRANAAILDGVMVEAYDSLMPLKQLASISVPESQLLQVTPYDPNNLAAIASAIRNNQNLGLNPADDGRVIRLPIPPLTEERRQELAKIVRQKLEDAMVNLRNIRHEVLNFIDKQKKDKLIGEDDAKRRSQTIEEEINRSKDQLADIARQKEQEILTI